MLTTNAGLTDVWSFQQQFSGLIMFWHLLHYIVRQQRIIAIILYKCKVYKFTV